MKMKKMRIKICGMMILAGLSLSACGTHTASRADKALLTARDAAECTMKSLKSLDLKQFNDHTDNYVETYHNWIGVPVEREYRVFNELLEPRAKSWTRKRNLSSIISWLKR